MDDDPINILNSHDVINLKNKFLNVRDIYKILSFYYRK